MVSSKNQNIKLFFEMRQQQERSLAKGSALVATVKQKMKMKEIYLSKPPVDRGGDGEPPQTHQTGFGRSKQGWEKCTVTG